MDWIDDNNRARIEGSNISLDSPEAIAKWIEDRKKRWPSFKVVEEKVSYLSCFLPLSLSFSFPIQISLY